MKRYFYDLRRGSELLGMEIASSPEEARRKALHSLDLGVCSLLYDPHWCTPYEARGYILRAEISIWKAAP